MTWKLSFFWAKQALPVEGQKKNLTHGENIYIPKKEAGETFESNIKTM